MVTWFDFVVLCVVFAGILKGRKRGMSEELLDLIKWLTIVLLAGFLHKPLGAFLVAKTPLNLLWGKIFAYLLVAGGVALFFTWIKKMVGEKLVGTDMFGALEYYLGMFSGAIRFSCILVFFLALLNAKFYSREELDRVDRLQQENFGSIRFPTWGTLQRSVFQNSATGQWIATTLSTQLIEPGNGSGNKSDSLKERRQRELDSIITGTR